MSWSWEFPERVALRLLGPVAILGRRQEQTIWTGSKTSWRDLARSAPQQCSDHTWMIFARGWSGLADQRVGKCQFRISGRSSKCSTT